MDGTDAKRLLQTEKERLRTLRDQARAALEQTREGGRQELASYDQHPADAAPDLHEREVNRTLIDNFDAQLQEVDDAFERVQQGTYGQCQQCGAALPDERLEAVPAARFCVEHQPEDADAP